MCAASHLAYRALYTVFLHLIAKFEIFPAEGTSADEIDPIAGLTGRAFNSTPKGFRARFVSRDGQKLDEWLEL